MTALLVLAAAGPGAAPRAHPGDRTSHTSAVVRSVQSRLASRGFDPGSRDGRWSESTTTALREFQRERDLAADGMPDVPTMSALFDREETTPRIERVRGADVPASGGAGLPRQTFGFGAACGFLLATLLASAIAVGRSYRERQRADAS